MRKNRIKKGYLISIIFLFFLSSNISSINSISNFDSFRINQPYGNVTWMWIDDDGAVWDDANTDEKIPYIPNAENVPLDIQFKILDSDGNPFGNLTEGQCSGLCETFIECAENITISGNSLFIGKLSDFPGFAENSFWYNDSIWIVPIIPTMSIGGGSITFDVTAYNESLSKTITIGGDNYDCNGSVVNVEPNEFVTGIENKTLLVSVKYADDGTDIRVVNGVYLYYLDDTSNGSIDDDIHGPITSHCIATTSIYSNGYYVIPFNITQQTKNQTTGLHGQGGAGFPSVELRRNLTIYVDGPGWRDGYALIKMVPPSTIYVDDDNTQGPWYGTIEYPYQFICDGINASTNGDTVFVFKGSYNENVIVDKSINLIGEDKDTTVIDGILDNFIVNISSDFVIISGFTIQYISTNSSIPRNLVIISSNYNVLSENIITGDAMDAIRIDNSKYNTIFNNIISSSHGIEIWGGEYNNISCNLIKESWGIGIFLLKKSNNNIVYGNTISKNNIGIIIGGYSFNNTILLNNITKNIHGIGVSNGFNCIISKNNFISNLMHADFSLNILDPFLWKYIFDSQIDIQKTIWDANYWNKERNSPKIIFGNTGYFGLIPLFNFDYNPAPEPYDI